MNIQCAHHELVELHKLQPNPKNPNKHPARQIELLAKIIDYQGQRAPIVVSKRSGFITKGHGRLEALKKLGWEKAAVDVQDYADEAQEYADMVADNKIAELAEHDDNAMITDIKLLGIDDFELLGLDGFEFPADPIEAQCDEDEVPEQADTRCKLGDIWQLGRHRLMCGDSTAITDVEKMMAGEKADMVFTDPPYGVGYEYNSHNDDTTKEKHMEFLRDLIGLATSLAPRFILSPGCNNLDAVAIQPKPNHVGCWTKTNAMSPGRVTHFWTWEPILFYGKWPRKRGNDVFNFPVGKQPDTGDHTCPKPIALWEDIVEHFSEPKDKIIDLFGGSGSTLIACEKTNRRCFMMEIDPHYCDVILARWEKYTGKTAERVDG